MAITLGIDIGTTKVAVVIYDTEKDKILDCASENTNADISTDTLRSEQKVERILETVDNIICSLGKAEKKQIQAIGLTGQMHGVVLWNENELSPLITWKDKRAMKLDTLKKINSIPGAENLKNGWGVTTLACLVESGELSKWSYASTIQDYFVYLICGLKKAVTDPSDAASWGCFDIINNKWNFEAIRKLKIPEYFFPEVLARKKEAFQLSAEFSKKWSLPSSLPVAVAIGDNQASILSTSNVPEDEIYLTLGTGAQLTVVIEKEKIEKLSNGQMMEIRPYLDNKYIAVAAPLCGGQAFAWLVEAIQNWQKELGLTEVPKDKLFRKLDVLGLEHLDTKLIMKPNFSGERHNPDLLGIIKDIDLNNFTLGDISAALARGIVDNLKQMMSKELLANKKVIIGSGNAVRRLRVIQQMIKRVFDLPLDIPNTKEEAACGAAISAARHV